jgi:predicted GNAT family acetyltransferase
MDFKYENNKIALYQNKEKIGNVVFDESQKGVKKVLSVFVSPEMRGKGVAKILMEKTIEIAKQEGFLIIPVCSYAIGFFQKYQDFNDVLYTG